MALSGRQDQTERARLRYGGHTPPPAPVDSTAGRGGGGAYTAKPLRLESVLIMGRKMYYVFGNIQNLNFRCPL